MYSYEDRIRAVKLYIKLGKRTGATIRQLGYPTKNSLKSWHAEYERCLDLPRGYENSKSKYGYRRMRASLSRRRVRISEKVVQRLMKQECLVVAKPKRRRYGSCLGEISPAPETCSTATSRPWSGQLIPDTTLSFSSARAGANPSLNW